MRAVVPTGATTSLNPSFALGHIVFGWALLRAGHFDEALVETGWALRMSPVDSFAGFYTSIHGLALLLQRRRKTTRSSFLVSAPGSSLRWN